MYTENPHVCNVNWFDRDQWFDEAYHNPPPSSEYRTLKLPYHSLKLEKHYSRTDVRKYTFSNCVVDTWNKLPEEVVTALEGSFSKAMMRKR